MLEEKLAEIARLADAIKNGPKLITKRQEKHIKELEVSLTTRLDALKNEFALHEADLKIDAMTKVINTLTKPNYDPFVAVR